MMEPEPGQARIRVEIAPELQGGAYANSLRVWHTPHEFTLDFAVAQPVEEASDGVEIPWTVVARVKVPPTVLFEMIRVLNANLTNYEQVYGEISMPEPKPE